MAAIDACIALTYIASMANLPLLPATVIGSWSFPGWDAKFCDDAIRHPELFGAEDRIATRKLANMVQGVRLVRSAGS